MGFTFDFTFTGHERDLAVAERIEELLRAGADSLGFEGIREMTVYEGFQPYITIQLDSGAEFQVTPVLSSQPRDDVQVRCDECGDVLSGQEVADGDSLCTECWEAYCRLHGYDTATGQAL